MNFASNRGVMGLQAVQKKILVLTHSIQFKPLEKFWLSRLCLDDKRK
jgi:hypothetical protein